MKSRLRIVLLFPHYGSIEHTGSLRSPQIANYLANKGHSITVFAPGVELQKGKMFSELKGRLYSKTLIHAVNVIRLRCLPNFRKSMIHRLLFECFFALSVGVLFFKVERPDIIIGAYPPAVLPTVGLFISKLLKVPYIFEVRDLMADALVANKYSKSNLFNKIAAFFENLLYRKADYIVTVSDGIKRIIVSKGISEDKITPVKNGFEPQVFENVDYSFDPRIDWEWSRRFVVIYAGGLTQSYDIPTLLKAAESTRNDKDILYVILGEGEKKESYKELCRVKALNNIQILDSVPRKKMPAILSCANVGVHLFPDNPLWSYVLGNKPFDYLGSGIPMIYSGTGDTAELVLNAKAGFVVHPERPSELVEKIRWLKDNPNEAKDMGKRGQEYVKTHFNRFELLRPLDVLLDKIMTRSNANARE